LTVGIYKDVRVVSTEVTSKHFVCLALRAEADFLTEFACELSLLITGETPVETNFFFYLSKVVL